MISKSRVRAAAVVAVALLALISLAGLTHRRRVATALATVVAAAAPAPPPAVERGAVVLTVDATRRHEISRLIYGINARSSDLWGASDTSRTTLDRRGGNRYTAFNWKTNDSNCGNDCGDGFSNDSWLAHFLPDRSAPAAVVTRAIDAARASGSSASMVTIPIIGWVAADHAGDTAPVPVARSADEPIDPGPRFRRSEPAAPSGALGGKTSEDVVYQDELVRLLDQRYPGAIQDPVRPLLFTLDNEPDLWGSTHARVRGRTGSGGEVLTGFDELVERSVAYSAAIKEAAPAAQVLAPGLSGWFGFYGLGHKNPPPGYTWYVDFYLERIARASAARGRRLVDALDVHWYPEARNSCRPDEKDCWSERITNDWQPQSPSVIEARVQAPRSLWDPTFTEKSWVARNTPDCRLPGVGCPVKLLPRLRESITRYAPGTRVAVTEYYYGRAGDISGAVAQADVLGIFGREGVFAAALWPQAAVYAWNTPAGACNSEVSCATLAYGCVFSAFKAFLDYDGKGGRFGDVGLQALASDPARASVYASLAPESPERIVVVSINKRTEPLEVRLEITGAKPATVAEAFRVTGEIGRCTAPERTLDVPVQNNVATATLSPLSINVWVVR